MYRRQRDRGSVLTLETQEYQRDRDDVVMLLSERQGRGTDVTIINKDDVLTLLLERQIFCTDVTIKETVKTMY